MKSPKHIEAFGIISTVGNMPYNFITVYFLTTE